MICESGGGFTPPPIANPEGAQYESNSHGAEWSRLSMLARRSPIRLERHTVVEIGSLDCGGVAVQVSYASPDVSCETRRTPPIASSQAYVLITMAQYRRMSVLMVSTRMVCRLSGVHQ